MGAAVSSFACTSPAPRYPPPRKLLLSILSWLDASIDACKATAAGSSFAFGIVCPVFTAGAVLLETLEGNTTMHINLLCVNIASMVRSHGRRLRFNFAFSLI
ncbi:hypothetical protein DFH09DRAFT_1357325 [Mycena vulgaris]|nr:hypothetical protein DFH09DRAFT_1357325 [Mycena vulgaris]